MAGKQEYLSQPTEADASTNLFIWTASQRLNYELEPAGAVTTMDFAVDQTPVQVTRPKPTSIAPPQPSPTEVLLAGKPVRMESAKPSKKRVEVVISDLYEGDGRVLVRYAIRNQGDHAYYASHAAGVCVDRSAFPTILVQPCQLTVGVSRNSAPDEPGRDTGPSARRAACSLRTLSPDMKLSA